MDWSDILSEITVIAAIISPIIGSTLTHYLDLRAEKIKYHREVKQQVFQDFLSSASCSIWSGSTEGNSEYAKSKDLIFLYSPPSIWGEIEKLDSLLSHLKSTKETRKQAHAQLAHIAKLLSSSINYYPGKAHRKPAIITKKTR